MIIYLPLPSFSLSPYISLEHTFGFLRGRRLMVPA
jgi:hypothetical protein